MPITSKPATEEYRENYDRIFRRTPDYAGYADAAKRLMTLEVIRSNAEVVSELRLLRALYRLPEEWSIP